MPLKLMLTETQQLIQAQGGTWSDLFSRSSWINQSDLAAIIGWYLFFALIGILFIPLTRIVFAGMRDRGAGVSRFFGLLVLGAGVWLAVSLGVSYTHMTILIALLISACVNLLLFILDRQSILADLKERRKIILQTEALFLGLFLFFLLIRLGNPDLWHPSKGGEKPMDFSYFNAVLKSTSFPPYDPWFAGGKLNYYYYGAYLAGLGVKALGIIPSVAYNLILPLWYAFLGSAFFSVITSISERISPLYSSKTEADGSEKKSNSPIALVGIFGVLIAQVFGNLGIPAMIAKEFVKLGGVTAPETASFPELFGAFFTGILRRIQGQPFQMYRGDWYWVPSRAIPGEPITEFPYFTFLYGDPHAHLFALPITVLILCWLGSLALQAKPSESSFQLRELPQWLGGALMLGSLIPANTWDFPTYLLLSIGVFFLIGLFRSGPTGRSGFSLSAAAIACGVGLLGAVIFIPYLLNNSQQNGIQLWTGSRTPVWSYLMHWGLFILCIVNWYAAETKNWMAETRLSSARQMLKKNEILLAACLTVFIGCLVFAAVQGVWIAWIALPMILWSFSLMFRSGNSAAKNSLYFLAGTAFFITIFVEFFSLKADLGRMNMVFKLYVQAWILFVLPASVGMGTFLPGNGKHSMTLSSWQKVFFWVLIVTAAGYPVLASIDKINDRISSNAPHVLDGMAYMPTSQYFQDGFTMSLAEDYAAIRWMQDHVEGSPVIVEGSATEYKWGNRYTIYTGLPGVIGWNYHQRQQRPGMSDQVWKRIEDVSAFYNEASPDVALAILKAYGVRYIVVGQMEKGLYSEQGIQKFELLEGIFWNKVFQTGETTVYQVNRQALEDFLG